MIAWTGSQNVTQMKDDIAVLQAMNISRDGPNALWLE